MLSIYLSLCGSFVVSFLITYFCVPLCKLGAHYFKILDVPNGTIKNHKAPTPYLGGLAIIIGFFSAVLIFSYLYKEFLPFWFGLLLFFLVGLVDDIYFLKPLHKMIGQCLASCWFMVESIYLKKIFLIHHIWLLPVVLFWVILITNAFNLIDILDGLASCVAFHACVGFLIIAIALNQPHLIAMIASLAGALMAFFSYNKPPATIYMGDAGSLFLGGFFAILPFFITWNVYNPLGFFSAFFILAVPIVEVGMLVVIRSYHRIAFYKASPHHFSHYLLGYQYKKSTILIITSIFCWINILIGVAWAMSLCSLQAIIILNIISLLSWSLIILQPLRFLSKK